MSDGLVKEEEKKQVSSRVIQSVFLEEKPKKDLQDAKKKPGKLKKKQGGGQINAKAKRQQAAQNRREESLKEVLGFFVNMIDEAKYDRMKPKQHKLEIFKSGGGDEAVREEVIQNEFLNKNEFSEFKGFYDDFGFGDLVLIFPNPDFDDFPNKGVTFKEAEKIFDEILTVMSDDGVSKSQMLKERNSFLYAFLMLNPYLSEEELKSSTVLSIIPLLEGEEKVQEQEEIEEPQRRIGEQEKQLTSWEKYQEFLKTV